MKALSIRQPWTAMIVHGEKRIENRSRRTHYRGPTALHASGNDRWDPAGEQSWLVQEQWFRLGWFAGPDRTNPHIVFSAVLAVADLITCHEHGDPTFPCDAAGAVRPCSPWAAEGQWHWELADVRPLAEPVPCKGALGLWTLSDEVEAAVRAQLPSPPIPGFLAAKAAITDRKEIDHE